MPDYEYKIVNAPRKATKVKGIRDHDTRFAQNITDALNAEAKDGWEYYRAESLPVDEKVGVIGKKTTEKYLPLLVFRRKKPIMNTILDVISDIQAAPVLPDNIHDTPEVLTDFDMDAEPATDEELTPEILMPNKDD